MRSKGLRTLAVSLLTALACAGAASGAPKPDPPPVPPPPPPAPAPQPAPPPPAAPQPVAPPPPVAVVPAGPSPSELAARQRAAAADRARQARLRAQSQRARLRAQRLRAARMASVKKQRQLEAAVTRASRPQRDAGLGSPRSATTRAVPFLLAGLLGAVFLLGVALTPARAVPWTRVSRALDDRRNEIAGLGGMGLFATALLFFFVTIVAR